MARFYAAIQGNRGEATRMGTANSGIDGHVRGWKVGGRVMMRVNSKGEDEVTLSITAGSNGNAREIILGSFTTKDLEKNIAVTRER